MNFNLNSQIELLEPLSSQYWPSQFSNLSGPFFDETTPDYDPPRIDLDLHNELLEAIHGLRSSSPDVEIDYAVDFPTSVSWNASMANFASKEVYEKRLRHFFTWCHKNSFEVNSSIGNLQLAVVRYFEAHHAMTDEASNQRKHNPNSMREWFSVFHKY